MSIDIYFYVMDFEQTVLRYIYLFCLFFFIVSDCSIDDIGNKINHDFQRSIVRLKVIVILLLVICVRTINIIFPKRI